MNKDNNMQNPKQRPQISQEVIKGFTAIVDAQDEKGFAKYGRSIDDANDADYDWKLMALEECADHAKYLVREIKRLQEKLKRKNDDLLEINTSTIKDAMWLIEKLSGNLGVDIAELEENYNDSYNRLEQVLGGAK